MYNFLIFTQEKYDYGIIIVDYLNALGKNFNSFLISYVLNLLPGNF